MQVRFTKSREAGRYAAGCPAGRRTRLHVSIGLREALLAYVGRRSDSDVRYGCSLR